MSLAKNIEFLRLLPKSSEINGLNGWSVPLGSTVGNSRLVETPSFGPNPGELRMFSFVPGGLKRKSALVVVLHGCTQKAAGYDIGAGWSTLAERYGFTLLMPEQKTSNNANGCFNWFMPDDVKRDSGEACSIRQMIAKMIRDHRIDRRRVFITGLSAGGAMTSVMLATYPEVFAGGAIIAGLPFGIATNMREALNGMFKSPSRSAREMGDLVRNASQHRGPWPKLSVWHGSADRTVNPSNASAIVKQWLDVHHLPSSPMSEATVDGHLRQIWWNEDEETIVESYTISRMSHGVPLGVGENNEQFGVEGAFQIEVGISSSYHIARFFGLTERVHQSKAKPVPISKRPPGIGRKTRPKSGSSGKPPRSARPRTIDVVITEALTAAGLIRQKR